MKPWYMRLFCAVLALMLVAALAGCEQEEPENYDFTVSYEGIATGTVSSGVAVHDPSILAANGKYYIYGSHMSAAVSDDLRHWKKLADGYNAKNPVYGQIYSVVDTAFAYAGHGTSLIPTDDGGVHVWAPDVIFNPHTNLYYMYYCTTSTWSSSNLCFGTSESPEGPFVWQAPLIYSGFNMETVKGTDVLNYVDADYVKKTYMRGDSYDFESYPNAIDPTVFFDTQGRLWMVYGSWSGGIFILELDVNTGLVIHPEADPANGVDPYFGKRLLGGGHKSIEAPYIHYDAGSGYYYLFVSYGALNRDGGYQIRVYRSENPDGPYVDMNGGTAAKGKNHAFYGLKLSGNYYLPGLVKGYKATGHNSAFTDSDGKSYIVFHTRFDGNSENHSPRVNQYLVNESGWPCMLPYQTQGETVSGSGYPKEEIVGRYFVINQGTTIDAEVAQPFILYLTSKGKVAGESVTGTWESKDGTYYLTLNLGDKTYQGVLCKMVDEAGTEVMAFSCVGYNESVWGVKYGQ